MVTSQPDRMVIPGVVCLGARLWLLAGILVSLHGCLTVAQIHETQEVCEGETFQARCPGPDQVVVIETALYGRMKLGNCAKVDMGFIGCQSDVLTLADLQCSGRRRCDLTIPDTTFESTAPCFELKSYLEVSYSCVSVHPVKEIECQQWQYLKVSTPSGFIASETAIETWCGTSDTPWLIEAQPGQRINITLYDFGLAQQEQEPWNKEPENDCRERYAIIIEESPHRVTPVCGGKKRASFVYQSNTNRLEIQLIPRTQIRTNRFLLHYQVMGCPDPDVVPSIMWFKRENEKITIGCQDSPITWSLRCDGYKWLGKYGNCTGYDTIGSQQYQRRQGLTKSGVVAIVAGTMLTVILLLVLFPVVVYFYRKHTRAKPRRSRSSRSGPGSGSEGVPVVEDGTFSEEISPPHRSGGGGGDSFRERGGSKEILEPYPPDTEEVYLKPAPIPRSIDSPPLKAQPLLGDTHLSTCNKFNTYQPEAPMKKNKGRSAPQVPKKNDYKHIWERPLPIPGEA